MKRFLKNKKGVSPIISTTLIFAILMTGVLVMYSWGLPLVIDFQDNSEVNDVVNQFYELDRNLKIVIHEGDGATRSSQFEFNKGLLNYSLPFLRSSRPQINPVPICFSQDIQHKFYTPHQMSYT